MLCLWCKVNSLLVETASSDKLPLWPLWLLKHHRSAKELLCHFWTLHHSAQPRLGPSSRPSPLEMVIFRVDMIGFCQAQSAANHVHEHMEIRLCAQSLLDVFAFSQSMWFEMTLCEWKHWGSMYLCVYSSLNFTVLQENWPEIWRIFLPVAVVLLVAFFS